MKVKETIIEYCLQTVRLKLPRSSKEQNNSSQSRTVRKCLPKSKMQPAPLSTIVLKSFDKARLWHHTYMQKSQEIITLRRMPIQPYTTSVHSLDASQVSCISDFISLLAVLHGSFKKVPALKVHWWDIQGTSVKIATGIASCLMGLGYLKTQPAMPDLADTLDT